MPKQDYLVDVYISYAGNDAGDDYASSRDKMVEVMCSELEKHNLKAREYKRDVQYKDSLKAYMEDIADADLIILFISKKYLLSEYCMYEAIELLDKNKRGFTEKVFPVVLPDAELFDIKRHVEYVQYWKKKLDDYEESTVNIDPKWIMAIHNKGIVYREIAEGISSLLSKLENMCQLSNDHVKNMDFSIVVNSILQQVAKLPPRKKQAVATQMTGDPVAVIGYGDGSSANIAAVSEKANLALMSLFNKIDERILDSQQAKKEYIDVQFDEISSAEPLTPLTQNLILKLRADMHQYEDYRRSLLISALSLGLIKKYDELKAIMLIDFVKDGEPGLSNRALTGLVIALLDKEDYMSNAVMQRLKKLQQDIEVQKALFLVFSYIGNLDELHNMSKSFEYLNFKNFEFFDKAQHWFLPFYKNNPELNAISNKKLAQGLFDSVVYGGIDCVKYALALMAPQYTSAEVDNLKQVFSQDEKFRKGLVKTGMEKESLDQIEVVKYLLEFYVYGVHNNDPALVKVIEDETNRTGFLYELLMSPLYHEMLQANEQLKKQEYLPVAARMDEIVKSEPNNRELLYLSGYAYYFAGKHAEAIERLEQVKKLGMRSAFVYAALGDGYYHLKQYDKAIENYEPLVEIQDNIPGLISLGDSYQKLPVPDNEKALQSHLRVYELEPANYLNLLYIGDCYYRLGNATKAYQFYYQAFELRDDSLPLLEALDELAFKAENKDHDFEKRFKIYSRYMELEPEKQHLYLNIGLSFELKDEPEFDRAMQYYNLALEKWPGNADILMHIGKMFKEMKEPDYAKALQYFDQVLATDPDHADAKLNAAWALFVLGDYQKSKEYFEANVKSPYSNVVYQNLGHIALISHNTTEARQLYKNSLDLFGNKDEFYKTSLTDLEYLQKAGVKKEEFIGVLEEVMKE